MKKTIISVLLLLLLPVMAYGQDSRQRAASTIIADALAQLPAQQPDTYNTLMSEIAGTGAQGIEDLALMLTPASSGQNAPVEYALYGVTAYSIQPGHEAERVAVRTGLKNAIGKTTDNENRAFLLTLLQNCATADDAPVFLAFVNDPYLSEWAINGLIHVPGTDDIILGLLNTDSAPRNLLAYAAAKKGIAQAEPILLKWSAEAQASDKKPFYRALALTGSEKSIPVLAAAAKATGYAWEDNSATESLMLLLERMAADGNRKAAAKTARAMLKATPRTNVRSSALTTIFLAEGTKALPLALQAMADPDRAYRVNALRNAAPLADDKFHTSLNRVLTDKKTAPQVKADIINWYGASENTARTSDIIPFAADADAEVACAAIKALGILGGAEALEALTAQLGGPNAPAAEEALIRFNGKVNPGIMKALDGEAATCKAALKIASTRHMTEATPKILTLVGSQDSALAEAAAAALPGVAEPADFASIAALAEKADGPKLASLQKAMKAALRNLPGEEQYSTVLPYINASASPARFYPVLAQSGTDQAVATLLKGYEGKDKEAAFNALLTISNPSVADELFNIAATDSNLAERALQRYATLVNTYNQNPGTKSQLYCKALGIASSDAARITLINALVPTNTFQAFTTAASYLDNKATAMPAAEAVRAIAARNIGTFDRATMRKVLGKAIDVFKADGSADSGYAVDDINGMLAKISTEPTPEFKLSPEEAAQGFEILFDGHSLDNWTGNTVDYIPVDGTILVSAQYGSGGNLYTVKEYDDFILRFEFCFDKEGVNNGIGIRTPMNVDAAYEGMEIQILDHDAPIYKGLRDYQVHGSVYGIIPAKRVVHRPLGEWGVEEIRAVGDHITVTVNGEVILDGNIRKACKGHNVAPDGAGQNPYTVDHLNHPGLFNKSGRIAFCGHGPGVRFRNIRIKDLGKSATR